MFLTFAVYSYKSGFFLDSSHVASYVGVLVLDRGFGLLSERKPHQGYEGNTGKLGVLESLACCPSIDGKILHRAQGLLDNMHKIS